MFSGSGISLGSIFGIEIRLDYSWLIIFVLIAWSFTANVIPTAYPELEPPALIIVGLLAAILLFLSVLIHEFAHGIYAKSHGIGIKRITLFLLGGVAEIDEEAVSPRQEVFMAAVGPLSSVALSILFGFVWFVGILLDFIALQVIGGILSTMNLVLALFNMIPAYPLDGGRVLRGIIWKFTDDLLKATRVAKISGQMFAGILIALGLMQVFIAGNIGGFWLILIAIFVNHSATQGFEQTRVQLLLKDMKVSELMTREYVRVPSNINIEQFLTEYVLKHATSTYIVEDEEDNIVGVVSAEIISQVEPNQSIVNYLQEEQQYLHLEDFIGHNIELIMRKQVVPVVDNGKVKGIVTSNAIRNYAFVKSRLKSSG